MAVDTMVVLPGDELPQEALPTPTGKKKTLTLGPGLRHIPPKTVATTIAGALVTDNKKNAAWIESNSGRYLPTPGDLVIATVNTSTAESFNCLLTPQTPYATLPHLAFEGATKKTRPQLAPHSLVYARVTSATRDFAPELTCVDPSTGKSEGLGPIKGGMVFKISLSMARRLLAGRKGGVTLLEVLGEKVGFEVTVGRNGLLHVDGGSLKATLVIGRAVQEVDEGALGEKAQKKVAERVLKSI
ncbi:exosome non-catalytic core subunit rrp40 [Kalmusia sp. IMI 367209]|nr:exosome non-catalytic core subunit rrp40 [Kalmusia sp. IMI 367209]